MFPNKLPIYFAPLQGYTEDVYRRTHWKAVGGVEAYLTPFIRLEHGELRSKDLRDVRPEFNEGVPVIPQLIARDGHELTQLLTHLQPMGYTRMDINMGCPFPLQTRHGRGCGLLPHPDLVRDTLEVVRQHPEVTFSVKMRLGLDNPEQWKAVLPLLNDAPLSMVTLHPRIGTQQYKGEVHIEQFASFLQACQHPVVYNGDVTSVEDIHRLQTDFPSLAGIMIGRGLLARPTLAYEYQHDVTCSDAQVLHVIRSMHDDIFAHYEQMIPGESQCLNKVRTYWEYMEQTLGRKTWKKVMKAGNIKNYLEAVRGIR